MGTNTETKKDWYECIDCGYAFDTEDIIKYKRDNTTYLTYRCEECYLKWQRDRMKCYRNSPTGKINRRKIVERNKKDPVARAKINARQYLNYHLSVGNIHKSPCSFCGNNKDVEAHHEDYSKPLSVIWLCPLHHRRYERGMIKLSTR